MARKSEERNIAYDDIKERYYVYLDYGKDSIGKRIKRSPSFKTIEEARECLFKFKADKARGLLRPPVGDAFEIYSKSWIVEKALYCEKTTIYGYQKMLDNHINPKIGHIILEKLTSKNLKEYINSLIQDKKLSVNTINKHHDLLKNILKKAVEDERILRNPMVSVPKLKKKQTEIEIYTANEMKELYEKIEGLPLEVPVKIAGYLGVRRGEVNALKWRNVDFKKQLITIKESRTSAGSEDVFKGVKTVHSKRKLFIPDELLKLLMTVKEKQEENKKLFLEDYQDNDYVFCKADGSLYSVNYCSNEFKRFLEKTDLAHMKFHGLRHTFASLANQAGVSMFEISRALGHSSPSITAEIYTHQFDKGNTETIQGVAKAIG